MSGASFAVVAIIERMLNRLALCLTSSMVAVDRAVTVVAVTRPSLRFQLLKRENRFGNRVHFEAASRCFFTISSICVSVKAERSTISVATIR